MKRIVIVEDSPLDSENLEKCVRQFFESISEEVTITKFNNGFDALDYYSGHEDIVFLDIDLPQMNGIELAKRIRDRDSSVIIIFCSNLANYALKGYEVSALDYIVKPFNYSNIEHRLKRALNVKTDNTDNKIILKISSTENMVCACNDIEYIEKEGNYLIFHVKKKEYKVRGSLKEYEELLPENTFASPVKGIYVNLSFVEKTTQNTVELKRTTLPLARQKKKAFISALFSYFGGKNGD